LGAKIPEDVAILGVDDDILVCELSDPPLSSIAMNTVQGGYEAAKLLMAMIDGKKVGQKEIVVLPTHITVRRSTDMLAIDDKEVINAIKYIKDNANKPLQVEDVVMHIALSRRTLEVKFQYVIGRTLHDFIKHTRIEKISELLRISDLSIKQIEQLLGYNNVNNLTRYYKQATGITCQQYRKKCRNTDIKNVSSHDLWS
jgi:LacI family transcriptional regulator